MSEMTCSCRTHSGGDKEKPKWWCLFCGAWKRTELKSQRTLLRPLSKDDSERSHVLRNLFLAVQEGRSEDVKEIVQRNPFTREIGALEGVLSVALHGGMFCVVDWIYEIGGVDPRTTDSLFIAASKRGDTRAMGKLLDIGASVNARDRYGCTSLHLTAERGDSDTLTVLLARGANASPKDENGSTPLHYAVRVCSLDSVQVLTRYGADLSAVNGHGCSLLHEALKRHISFVGGTDIQIVRHPKKEYLDMIGFLLRNVPDVSNAVGRVDKSGNSCFHYAVQNLNFDNIEAINLLLDAGSSINTSNGDGMTPLFISVQKLNEPVARSLMELGADIEAKAPDGSTALHAAVSNHYHRLVDLLLEFRADVDAATCDGVTPFQMALYWPTTFNVPNVIDSVVSLVQHGADIVYSVGYRPNPLTIKDFSRIFLQPLSSVIPILIYATRCGPEALVPDDADSPIERWSKLMCKRCVYELTEMKRDRIGNRNFYELLVCRNRVFLKYMRNKAVSDSFASKYHLSNFDVYGPVLEAKHAKASKRLQLLKSGIRFFNELFKTKGYPVLPEECVAHILDYLKDSHLKKIETVLLCKRLIDKDEDSESELNKEQLIDKWLLLRLNCLEIIESDNR